MTTPGVTAPDPAGRARATLGTALGIVVPSAVPLRDGRIWLTSRRDVLPADVARALEEKLSARAADRISDERMLAEAVATLGTEIARARGESTEAGATDALDRLLHTPGLDQSRRTEGEAMLRLALRLHAQESSEAAARLAAMPGETRVPVATAIVSAAQQISRNASQLGTPAPAQRRSGRHRNPVGVSHRRTDTQVVRGTALDPTGRTATADPQQSELAALAALTQLGEADLGSSVTSRPAVSRQSRLATMTLTTRDAPQHVRVEILPTNRGLAAQGTLRSGTANDPHVLRIAPWVPEHQYRQIWVRQLSRMTQQMQAEQAERPRGILGQVRSMLGSERREQRLNEDYTAYQQLSRDREQAQAETLANGQPSGPRSVADLERDIRLQAGAIWWRSGTMPTLPWAQDSTYSPSAAVDGIAAERAVAAANPEANTPEHLRQQVVDQIAELEAAAADLQHQADTKVDSAATTADQATSKVDLAEAEDLLKDRGAPERARKLRAEATAAFAKARRHTELAHAYQQAANDAGAALAGYQAMLARIDDPDHEPEQIAELAREAAAKTDEYQASLRAALPVDHLETGVPTDQHLNLPVEAINAALLANQSGVQVADTGPLPVPGAQYRKLFSDGMVFSVAGSPDDAVGKVRQVRVRVKAENLRERTDLDYDMAEQMSATLGEGGHNNSITDTHARNVSVGLNLQPLLAAAPPGSAVQAASQVFAPRVDGNTGKTLAETAGASTHAQLGWVDVHKGESVPYSWTGEYEIQVRNSPTEPWSAVTTVSAGEQLTWVPSPYTVKAQADTVTLEQLGFAADLDAGFPRHTVNRITGLHDLNDRLVIEATQKLGAIDRIGYEQILGRVTEDPYRLLGEFAKPGGLSRTIQVGGESAYRLTVEVEPVWATAELVGACSGEMGQEKVEVDFAATSASRASGTSLSGSASVAYPGTPLDPAQPVPAYLPSPTALSDVGSSTVDLSANVSAGRNVSRQGGLNLSTTAITPVVDRDMSPTQGVLVDLKVTATLRKIGDPDTEPVVVSDTCQAKLRLTANRLLRTGAAAGKDAVLRDDDSEIRLDQHGRALLVGDPEPPAGPQTVPPWHGTGENQMRGTGKALPDGLTGVDEARQQALTKLSELGLVPPLDNDFQPLEDKEPSNRQRTAQQRNYDRVVEAFTDYRMVSAMNTACQSGLMIHLVDHSGRTPRDRLFRLKVTQDFGDVKPAGSNPSRTVTRLGISSRAIQAMLGRSRSVPVSGGIGAGDGPAEGQPGFLGRLGVKLSRNALARSFSQTVGSRINRVTLHESTAPVDNLDQKIRITFTEVTPDGDSEPLADVVGTMSVAYDSSLAQAEEPEFAADPQPPHPEAVSRSIPVAMDAGNPADRLYSAVDAIRADTVGFAQLHAALSPEAMLSNKEWITDGRYELPLVITPAPANPAQALEDRTVLPQSYKIVIRSEPVSQTFAAMNYQVTGDINLTMVDTGFTSGSSTSGGVGLEGGGGPAATPGDPSTTTGKVNVGRVAGRSQSTGTSQTSGDERLLINTGMHYELLERHRLVADVMQDGKVVQTVPLQDALVQKVIPEYTALELYGREQFDLPLPIAADVAERYLTNKVEMSPRTAGAFVRRYKQEKAGVTTGLAAEHTDERLTRKVMGHGKAPESTAPTPAERLEDTLARTEQVAAEERAVGLPNSYRATLGSSQPYELKQEGPERLDVDLLPQIREQVEEVAPGRLATDQLLAPALEATLAKDAFKGHLVNMLGPRGYTAPPIEIPVEGQDHPDLLLVTVKAHFEGDILVDGTPGLPKVEAVDFDQKYGFESQDQSTGRSITHSGGVELKGEDGDGTSMSGGLSADRIRQVSAASGKQNTTLHRTGDLDLTPVTRRVVFTTEVERVHRAGAAAMSSTRWRLTRTTPAELTTTAQPRELRAVLTSFVPRGVVREAPDAGTEQATGEFSPEHRPFVMPEGAQVASMLPYREGAVVTDELYNRLTAHLARPGVLGVAGLAEHKVAIGTQLLPMVLEAKFEQLTGPGGLKLEPLMGRGNGRTTIAVQVNARPVGIELLTDGVPGQSGIVRRYQHKVQSSTTGNQVAPVTVTGGFNNGIVSMSASVGEQVKKQSSDAVGTRLETIATRGGDLVDVRFPVTYDLTINQQTDSGRGTPTTKNTTHLRDAARGEFYVRMLYHEYLDILQQMESGGDVSLDGLQLQAMPEKLGKPDMRATEYGEDASGQRTYQPYQPMLAAIDKAMAERTTVVLAVQEDGGQERLYQAVPVQDERGVHVVLSGVSDGGFAAALGSLDRRLVQMAQSAHPSGDGRLRVDLRELFNTTERGGNFSTKVAAALEQNGVPTAMLKGLDYSRTVRPAAPVTNQGKKPTVGGAAASRTITPTTSGPSMAGP
ncbi:hypothetical protein AB0H36_13715 [Kribbella sp. NPDC050820]|uniref:hypothetical protein n=1 Tax=Kribbella sp. NPDC050820 TaxID=3155408 RepID=UPI0033FF9ACA